jgi:ATP-binding cassette subfamily B protein
LNALRFVISYTRRYRRALIITIGAMLLLVGVQLAGPWIIRELIAALSGSEFTEDTLAVITRLALLGLGVYFAKALFTFVKMYYSHVAGWGVVADVRKYIYERMQRFKLRFYEDKQTGQLMTRVMDDTGQFEDLIAHAIPDVFVSIFMLIGVLLMLLLINWRLTLLALIPIPFVVWAMRGYARYIRPAFRERQKELSNINAILNDNLSGIRDIKAFTREEQESRRFNESVDRHRFLSLKAIKMISAFDPFVDFLGSLGTLVVIYVGGRLAFNQTL